MYIHSNVKEKDRSTEKRKIKMKKDRLHSKINTALCVRTTISLLRCSVHLIVIHGENKSCQQNQRLACRLGPKYIHYVI